MAVTSLSSASLLSSASSKVLSYPSSRSAEARAPRRLALRASATSSSPSTRCARACGNAEPHAGPASMRAEWSPTVRGGHADKLEPYTLRSSSAFGTAVMLGVAAAGLLVSSAFGTAVVLEVAAAGLALGFLRAAGLAMAGLAMAGLVVAGLAVVHLGVAGFVADLDVADLDVADLEVVDLEVADLKVAGLVVGFNHRNSPAASSSVILCLRHEFDAIYLSVAACKARGRFKNVPRGLHAAGCDHHFASPSSYRIRCFSVTAENSLMVPGYHASPSKSTSTRALRHSES